MKRFLRFCTVVLLFALGAPAHAGTSAGSMDPDREVLVLLRPGALRLANAHSEFVTSAASFRDASLGSLLASHSVEAIGRACPDAKPSDARKVLPDGRVVKSLDLSNLFRMRLPAQAGRADLIANLRTHPEVLLAEPNARIRYRGQPNDSLFRVQWNMQNIGQSSGTPRADIDAPLGWNITTGSGLTRIGIVDEFGVDAIDEEWEGRVTGQVGSGFHATMIAGIAAAAGNNGRGIAGVHWTCPIISEVIAHNDVPSAAAGIRAAVDAGAHVINASWGFDNYTDVLADAFAYAYQHDVLVTVAMPEQAALGDYPSKYQQFGVINVAATNNFGAPAVYHVDRPFVDVSAPGGNRSLPAGSEIWSTAGGQAYDYDDGTSYAAAHVTGIAALLRTRAQSLEVGATANDLRGIIRANADDIAPVGFDVTTGYGGANLRRALVNFPYDRGGAISIHNSVTGGTGGQAVSIGQLRIYNLSLCCPGPYYAVRHTVDRQVTWPDQDPPYVWGTGNGTVGWPEISSGAEAAAFNTGWCEPISVTRTGATLRTYVYYITNALGVPIGSGWYPCQPSQVVYKYTTYTPGVTGSPSTPVDVSQSFFVPEAGSVGAPLVGTIAIAQFRTCPNNDAMINNQRVRIVARDSQGSPIAGIDPAEVFLLLNGGTAAQGFGDGAGADSIIANSKYNSAPACPNLRMVYADSATDAAGTTYITFTGSTPGNRGVGTRDPNRKWGHYDSEIPVYVRGVRLQGRLTTGSPNGSYGLQIKNLDLIVGLDTAPNLGETVNFSDFNYFTIGINQPDSADPNNWWRDFDSNGTVGYNDNNLIVGHLNQDCDTPNNP